MQKNDFKNTKLYNEMMKTINNGKKAYGEVGVYTLETLCSYIATQDDLKFKKKDLSKMTSDEVFEMVCDEWVHPFSSLEGSQEKLDNMNKAYEHIFLSMKYALDKEGIPEDVMVEVGAAMGMCFWAALNEVRKYKEACC